MSRVTSRFLVVTMATLLATGWLSAKPKPVVAVSPDIVISEVYGGGGNTGATLTNDFIELYNRGASPVDVTGWSVQYASATGNTWQVTGLSGSIAAGGNYLVQEAVGAGGTTPLPPPDASGSIPMSATAGKVALVTTTTALACATGCATIAGVRDFVGYGSTASSFEGPGPAPGLSNTTSASRAGGGTTDTDSNSADFTAGAPDPDNSGAISLSINNVSQPEGPSGSGLMHFTVSLSAAAGSSGVTFDIATSDGPSPNATAGSDYVAQSLTGQLIASGQTSYTFSVIVNGDGVAEPDENFTVTVSNVSGAILADGVGMGTLTNDDSNPCDEAFTPIYSIQGSNPTPAITGNVTTEGVVVGDFEGPDAVGFLGFYIQDPTGDGNAATSDGIYVFTNTAIKGVSVGDHVRVAGFARDRFNETSISGSNSNTAGVPVENILICSSGNPLPAQTDITLPVTALGDFEKYEGMRVRFPQQLVIAEYFNYDRFGELVLALPLPGESRPFTGTAIDEPGAPANARTLANSLRRITLDDGLNGQNPEFTRHPNGDGFSLTNRFRGGDKVENAAGVLGFAFSQYRIQPTADAAYIAVNGRPPEPEPVGGSLRVAAMNTLNFFVTGDAIQDDTGGNNPDDDVCGGNGNLECRGWDTNQPTELTRQRDKLVRALAGIDADVLGLNELENSPVADPLLDPEGIIPALNALLGEDVYSAIDTGPIGTDAIRVGLIYKHDVVTPIGSFQVLDSTDDPRFIDTRSRPALAQTFEEIATGSRFTVVVNHLKSKGSACTDIGDPDTGDGQGNCNLTRLAAAQALVDWIALDPTGSGDPDFLIMGDLNSYAMEDPIDAIKAGSDDTAGTADDWTNLIEELIEGDKYSFVFDGQAGYLDHALANATIVDQVTGVTEWHINADEPDLLDYDTSFKSATQDSFYELNGFRTSDHDPVIVGLGLVNDPPTIEVSAGSSCSNLGLGGTFQLTVDDNEVAAADLDLSLESNTNAALVPSVTFGGAGASRTVAITVAPGQSGTATITIGVNDGFQTTTTTITVKVGSMGSDSLTGGSGADLLIGGLGGDTLSGAGGADVLCGGLGGDTLSGGDGNDALEGERGADTLSGGDGNDVLRGGQGDDALAGNAGDDTLTGNAGADSFSGGAGDDTFTDVTPSQGDTTDGS